MNVPECKELKVKYDTCIKQHVKNTLLAWYNAKVGNSIVTTTSNNTNITNNNNDNNSNNVACDESFKSYKECVDNMMLLRIIENQKKK